MFGIVGWKKFLLIPALIILYILFIDWLTSLSITSQVSSTGESGGGSVEIGLGHAVSVTVVRPYLFGLVKLPVYSAAFGDISIFHDIFFYFILALTVIFVLMEKFPRKMKLEYKRRYEMPKKFDLKKLAMAVGLGFLMGFLAFLFTEDGGSSLALALLVIYLELRFK